MHYQQRVNIWAILLLALTFSITMTITGEFITATCFSIVSATMALVTGWVYRHSQDSSHLIIHKELSEMTDEEKLNYETDLLNNLQRNW